MASKRCEFLRVSEINTSTKNINFGPSTISTESVSNVVFTCNYFPFAQHHSKRDLCCHFPTVFSLVSPGTPSPTSPVRWDDCAANRPLNYLQLMYLVAICLMCLCPLSVFDQIEKLRVRLVMFYEFTNKIVFETIDGTASGGHSYLCRSVNSRYSSGGFIFCKLKSIFFWISLNVSAVRSQYCDASSNMFFLWDEGGEERKRE